MSDQDTPTNITINVSDTVPLSLYREMQARYNSSWNSKQEMEQTAAELRIEVAALTVGRDSYKTRISGLHNKVRELEAEKHTLLEKIAYLNTKITKLIGEA